MDLLGSILSLLVGGMLGATYAEKKAYNNGICPKCGDKLEYFDTDSQGSRGYTCLSCNYTTWCSYPVDHK